MLTRPVLKNLVSHAFHAGIFAIFLLSQVHVFLRLLSVERETVDLVLEIGALARMGVTTRVTSTIVASLTVPTIPGELWHW